MWPVLSHPLAALTTTIVSATAFLLEATAKGHDYQGVALLLTAVATLIGALATAAGAARLWFRRDKGGVTLTDEQFADLVRRK